MDSILEPPEHPDDYSPCPDCRGRGFRTSDVVRGTCLSDAWLDEGIKQCDECLGLGRVENE